MLNMKKEDWLLVASGFVTLAVVAYVDVFLEHGGDIRRLFGYLVFACMFGFLESGLRAVQPWWVRCSGLTIEAGVGLAMYLGDSSTVMPILFVIWAAQLPKALPGRLWWLLLVLVNGVIITYGLLVVQTTHNFVSALVFLGFQWFAASSSAVRIRAKQASEALELMNIQLKSAQSLLAQRGKAQERLRIARDLHDGIGHKLTALSLKLEHARHTLEEPARPLLSELKNEVADILRELRHTVQHIRSGQQISLTEIIDDIRNILPASVTITYQGDFDLDNVELGEQLAYCIQEAVHNALRHGNATHIHIEQTHRMPLCIVISDNGLGTSTGQARGGLKGMSERLAPFNGEAVLKANPQGAGMQLTLTINDTYAHD